MIAMSFRTFNTKVLIFISSNLPSVEIGGRHSTTDIPYKNYILSENVKQANNKA